MLGFWFRRSRDRVPPDFDRRDRAKKADEHATRQLEERRLLWPKTRDDSRWARETVDANHLTDLFNDRGRRRHA